MTKVYVVGVATHEPSSAIRGSRLEEMVYRTARAALDDAGVSRRQIDNVTIAACDEFDGRPISSMLLSGPAGAYLVDEIKVTDDGAMGLCLGLSRIQSGDFDLGLVASWSKTSKTDVESIMNNRAEPFFTRPLGMNMSIANGLFAQAVAEEFGVTEDEATTRVVDAYERASANSRGMNHSVPTTDEVRSSPFEATPLREGHNAPITDGAVCLVLASEQWLHRHPGHEALARVAGVGWATDSYRLDRERLRSMSSARAAWDRALADAGVSGSDLGAVEIDTPTSYHEAAYARIFDIDGAALSPAGSTFAQHPLFCSGLVNAAEAILQAAGRAGPVQKAATRWTAAHSCHGFAQQGNVAMVFEGSHNG